jgi:hypothetical protein
MGAAAYAAIPDADGNFYACVANSSGTIRLIQKSATCRASERLVSWPAAQADVPVTTTYVKRADKTVNAAAVADSVVAFCDSGDVATGGGFQEFSTVLEVRDSQPAPPLGQGTDPENGDNPVGWHVNVRKTDAVETPTFTAFAVCQHTE